MLGRLALALLVATASPAAASQPLAINATCAAALAGDTTGYVRTLRDGIARALVKQPNQIPAGYTIDVALVRLDVIPTPGSELQIRAEVRAALSDARGVVIAVSTVQSIARGPQRDRALLQRDVLVETAWQLAARLAKRS